MLRVGRVLLLLQQVGDLLPGFLVEVHLFGVHVFIGVPVVRVHLVGVHGHASAGFGDAARIEDAGREARVVQTHQDVAHGVPEADEEHLARVDGIVGRHGRRSEGDGRGGGLVGGRGEGAAGGTAT